MYRVTKLRSSSVGKKILMSLTGVILVAFVIGHMVGNLKMFLGRDAFNAYAKFLRTMGEPAFPEGSLLWIARFALLAAVGIHVWYAWETSRTSWAARPIGYKKVAWDLLFSAASRTMRWGGVALAAFVVYHLMHLTWGNAHPSFSHDDPFANVLTGFRSAPVVAVYCLAMVPLCLHLYHGVWSATQTLALTNPRWEPARRPAAAALAVVILAGNCAMPLAVLAGFVK